MKSYFRFFIVVTEQYKCPVCYQLYKNPKYLNCHHSYCEGCLERLQVESKITCPQCRTDSLVPVGGVKDLPANSFISNRMNKLGLKREEDDEVALLIQKCNECDEDEPVVAYCQICSSNLCQFCYENHKRSKRFRDHNTATVTKLRSNKNVIIQPNAVFLTCKDHEAVLLFYCETCAQLVCEHCVVKGHHDHSYAKARIQACKCQIELQAFAPLKVVGKNLSEAHDTTNEIKKVL